MESVRRIEAVQGTLFRTSEVREKFATLKLCRPRMSFLPEEVLLLTLKKNINLTKYSAPNIKSDPLETPKMLALLNPSSPRLIFTYVEIQL